MSHTLLSSMTSVRGKSRTPVPREGASGLACIFHTRAWAIHTPRRFAPPLSIEGTRSVAGEIPAGEGCPTGRGVSVRIRKCEKSGLESTRRRPAAIRLLALALLVALPVGCAHAPMNVPLAASGAAAGSRYRTGRNRPDDSGLMIALFFSGGGTRAAAFAYGVLRELSATPVPGGRRMLDEVTTINAVSGGSFTAAYFCLYGDRIFSDFEGKFLKYDVQGTLYRRFLSPLNATRLLDAV